MILVGSIAAAALLLVFWLIGFVGHFGGSLIHLLLVLALVVGVTGFIVGLVVMLAGKKAADPYK